jgi:hypothetical protein
MLLEPNGSFTPNWFRPVNKGNLSFTQDGTVCDNDPSWNDPTMDTVLEYNYILRSNHVVLELCSNHSFTAGQSRELIM